MARAAVSATISLASGLHSSQDASSGVVDRAHAVGGNHHADVIRIASIYEYHKTPASLPDATMRARAGALPGGVQPGIWEDWAPAVREQAAGREAAAKL